jgi:hypothetical protein
MLQEIAPVGASSDRRRLTCASPLPLCCRDSAAKDGTSRNEAERNGMRSDHDPALLTAKTAYRRGFVRSRVLRSIPGASTDSSQKWYWSRVATRCRRDFRALLTLKARASDFRVACMPREGARLSWMAFGHARDSRCAHDRRAACAKRMEEAHA